MLGLANTLVSKLGTIGIGIVLARMLGPSQFGTYAIAFIALIAILSFNELGISLAIVRWPGDPREIASTVTTISLASSALIFAGALAAAQWFADAMGDASAAPVVRVMAGCVVINGAVATPAALLQRDFLQGTRMVIDQVNVWLGAVVSVVLVVLGTGAMSLAIGRVVASVAAAVLFLRYSPLPTRLGFNRGKVGPLLRFGLPLAGSSILVFAVGYVDQIVAGRMLGSVVLGLYVLATNLANWPANIFSQPLRSVAPPVFARLQHDPSQMREAMLTLLAVVTAVVMPVVTVMAGTAVPLVTFVYGSEWLPAAEAVVWLATFTAVKVLFELVYDYLVVVGRSGLILNVQILWFAALLAALIAGATVAGLRGVAAAPLVVAVLAILPVYLVILRRHGFSLRALAGRVWLPVAVSVPLFGVSVWFASSISNPLLAVLAATFTGCVVLTALLLARRADLATVRAWGRQKEGAR
ncbi:oligosaccharide flippase family protein [Tersicoccus phoenicis]|uniref:oligosaccharide flippase family protein n=1 Tax=Tersicoccus phoenicis TaxID=554083 RepID=UPI001F342307|nr:oligosaccharide flippase family protein [Tersicoccus phoenicis]